MKTLIKMHIYPRFHTSSLANVIASGAFTGAKDSSLFQHMNLWHQFASDYNNRLYHTELRVFNNKDAARTYNSLLVNGEVGQQAFKTLNELMDMLLKEYKNETEINSNNIETKLKVALNRRA